MGPVMSVSQQLLHPAAPSSHIGWQGQVQIHSPFPGNSRAVPGVLQTLHFTCAYRKAAMTLFLPSTKCNVKVDAIL